MATRYKSACWAVVLSVLLVCLGSEAGQAKGGGGGGGGGGGARGGGGRAGVGKGGNVGAGNNAGEGRNDPNNPKNEEMSWLKQTSDALSEAQAQGAPCPILAVLHRAGNVDDNKVLDKLASWPQLQAAADGKLVIVLKLKSESSEGQDLIKKLNLKTVPVIVWLDTYGNPIQGQQIPDTVQPIMSVIANWKPTLAAIERFFIDHHVHGDRYLARGKLREAYLEYSFGPSLKGPLGERARTGQGKVKQHWTQLAEIAAKLPTGSRDREVIVKGLRKETLGTDFAASLEQTLQSAAATPQVAAAAPAGEPAARSLAPAASVMPVTDNKPLLEIVSARPQPAATERDSDETAVDSRFLGTKTDAKFKEAEKLLQDGILDYRKATAENADRGPARNELLKSAHAKFEKTLALLDEATAGKPDPQTEKLMERTSMLLYGSLKYQSL